MINKDKTPLIMITPLIQGTSLGNLPVQERSVYGTAIPSLQRRHSMMCQLTVMKNDIQNTHNKTENEPVAPHVLEVLAPIGLVMNQGTAEAVLRATSPVKVKYVYKKFTEGSERTI